MGSKRKLTAKEKLNKEQEAKLVDVPERWQKRFGAGKMLIPRPIDVDTLVKKVRKGRLLTTSQLREKLARDKKADVCCPLTAGIFLRVAAEAAEEDRESGRKRITPYWRVIKDDGSLNEKFPGGAKGQAEKLKDEGHIIMKSKGKKPPKVMEFDKKLFRLK